LLTGCATERFGREQHVTAAEKTGFTYEQIDLEIAKVDGFLTDAQAQWDDAKGRRFFAFLADFGIGNRRERSDAIDSADERRQQLLDARTEKHCPGAPAPRPVTD
jgi:hypothetical protein